MLCLVEPFLQKAVCAVLTPIAYIWWAKPLITYYRLILITIRGALSTLLGADTLMADRNRAKGFIFKNALFFMYAFSACRLSCDHCIGLHFPAHSRAIFSEFLSDFAECKLDGQSLFYLGSVS